jgi:hypothetical protein
VHAGVRVVQDVLSNSLPYSFFPGPMPFSNRDGYTMQVLASVQVSFHVIAARTPSCSSS